MASKLFNKLRKHKSADIDQAHLPQPAVASLGLEHIEDAVEYSLPPDCESDDDAVYREPADSLNAVESSTTSSHSRATPTTDTLESEQSSLAEPGPQVTMTVDSTDDQSAASTTNSTPTQDTMAGQQALSPGMGVKDSTDGKDSASFNIYMNDSEIRAAVRDNTSNRQPAAPVLTPDVDPRNAKYAASANEYESPWDLQLEIDQVVQQMNNPSTMSSTHSLAHKQEDVGSRAMASLALDRKPHEAAAHKVDYESKTAVSHKVKHPSVHRQSGKQKPSPSSSTLPGSGAVLVEGEWREAKHTVPLASPSSPELTSPPQIISQPPVGGSRGNTATNFIYDKANTQDIKVAVNYGEEKPKRPFAQPRLSVSTSPSNAADDQLYENMTASRKSTSEDYDVDGVYDDPWNVEQVQQDIFDQLEKQKTLIGEGKQRRASEDLTRTRDAKQDIFAVPVVSKRLGDLPSEGNSSRSAGTASRRLLSANAVSSTEKIDKLSPRAIHKGSVKSAASSHLAGPHVTKPVLVIQRNNEFLGGSHDRKGLVKSSTRVGSSRKTRRAPSTPLDNHECDLRRRIGINVNKKQPITQQPWYHGALHRFQAEELLHKHPDGSFLVRESINSPRDKTLSLKNSSGCIHIKIVHQPDGTVILGQFSHPFKSIMEMVEYYSRHRVNIKGAEHTYLEIPVLRDR